MWIYRHLVISAFLIGNLNSASFPETPEGMCQCGVVGDPLVVFYDKQVALLTTPGNYLVSMIFADPSLSDCSFQYWVQTKVLDNGLVVPEGVTIVIETEVAGVILSRTLYVTDEGAWMAGDWLDSRPFDDGVVRLEDIGNDGTISISPGGSIGCNLQFFVKMANIHSRTSMLVDNIMVGNDTLGLCGNCNGVRDDYGESLAGNPLAPLLISPLYNLGSTDFPSRAA